MEQMTFLDFFAGIGGFRKGFELCGMRCVGHCEIDKYADRSYRAIHDVVHNIWKPSGCRITQWGQLGEILGGVRFPWAGSLPVTDDFPICAGCQGQMAHNKKTNRILYFAGNGAGLMACPDFRLT